MRKRNREINIFSMSALDLFASAMGAFMLISLISLPFYLKTDSAKEKAESLQKQLEQLAEKNDRTNQELKELQRQTERTQSSLEECQGKMSRTYLIALMKWETEADIDMHVIDPFGNEYYFKRHNRRDDNAQRPDFPEQDAELSVDTIVGPGIEVWETAAAAPGTYKIFFHYFGDKDKDNKPTEVKGTVFYRDGSHIIKATTLTYRQSKQVAAIVVDDKGNVTIQ